MVEVDGRAETVRRTGTNWREMMDYFHLEQFRLLLERFVFALEKIAEKMPAAPDTTEKK